MNHLNQKNIHKQNYICTYLNMDISMKIPEFLHVPLKQTTLFCPCYHQAAAASLWAMALPRGVKPWPLRPTSAGHASNAPKVTVTNGQGRVYPVHVRVPMVSNVCNLGILGDEKTQISHRGTLVGVHPTIL